MKPLSGLGVLVTRPAHQAGSLIERLQQAGAEAYSLPVIEIEPLPTPVVHANYDLMIFISVNAVKHGAKLYASILNKPCVAAIGQATALSLTEHGIKTNLTPDQIFTSEALLEQDTFSPKKISGQRILIVRGQGGREHLADTLRARGALVDYAEVYRRVKPQSDVCWLQPLWEQQRIHLVMVTSNEALENLYHMLEKQRHWLLNTPLLVPGERCHQLATQLGFTSILTAHSASDDAMIKAILNWHKHAI